MAELFIGDRAVGPSHKALVIAEIGINHGGKLDVALEMAKSAQRAGAEIVKHQTHIIDDEMSPEAKRVIPGNDKRSIYEIMKKCALTEDEEIELKKYIEALGMIFISTPFSRKAAERLKRMKVKAYKIGSGECNNIPLVRHIAKDGKPIILSTGMNDIQSVKETAKVLNEYEVPFALLHTTNLYPTPPHLVRLGAMEELMREFPNNVIGLSDHTLNNTACIAATTLGASILERHYTDVKTREGPDIVCSMDEEELRQLIATNDIHIMRGGIEAT